MKKFVIALLNCKINPIRPAGFTNFFRPSHGLNLLPAIVLLFFGFTHSAHSDEQVVRLVNGWNAVYLNVTPEQSSCDAVFATLPEIGMAYSYENTFSSAQFMEDEASTFNNDPKWLIWRKENAELGLPNGLHSLIGGYAYILNVKLGAGETEKVWTITGTRNLKNIEWRTDQFNLVGFQFGAVPPAFKDFFSDSPSHSGQAIYTLNSETGSWERLWCWEGANMKTEHQNRKMQNGEAFWIYSKGYSDFQGPLKIVTDQISGLDYDTDIVTHSVMIYNTSPAGRSIEISLNEDTVPLYYRKVDNGTGNQIPVITWENLLTAPLQKTLKAGESFELQLAVDRKNLAGGDSVYFSQLTIKDGNGGYMKNIPVKTKKRAVSNAGLWVGAASIDKVSRMKKGPDPLFSDNEMLATAAPFQFRLIVHVDDSGKAKLLKEVTQMLDVADEQNPQPVLLDSRSKAGNYSGVALRDGVAVGRRISSAAFAEDSAEVEAGAFGAGKVEIGVETPFNDPLNPFYHKFHPDHDNLDDRFAQTEEETFSVKRNIALDFSAIDSAGFYPGKGDNLFQGDYSEVIQFSNTTNNPGMKVKVSGKFELSRVSDIETIVPAN